MNISGRGGRRKEGEGGGRREEGGGRRKEGGLYQAIFIIRIYNLAFLGNSSGGYFIIPGDHSHFDTSINTILNGFWYLLSYNISDTNDTNESQAVFFEGIDTFLIFFLIKVKFLME